MVTIEIEAVLRGTIVVHQANDFLKNGLVRCRRELRDYLLYQFCTGHNTIIRL